MSLDQSTWTRWISPVPDTSTPMFWVHFWFHRLWWNGPDIWCFLSVLRSINRSASFSDSILRKCSLKSKRPWFLFWSIPSVPAGGSLSSTKLFPERNLEEGHRRGCRYGAAFLPSCLLPPQSDISATGEPQLEAIGTVGWWDSSVEITVGRNCAKRIGGEEGKPSGWSCISLSLSAVTGREVELEDHKALGRRMRTRKWSESGFFSLIGSCLYVGVV